MLIVILSYFVLAIKRESDLGTHFAMHRRFWPQSIYTFLEVANLTIFLTMFHKTKNIHNFYVHNNNLITNNNWFFSVTHKLSYLILTLSLGGIDH